MRLEIRSLAALRRAVTGGAVIRVLAHWQPQLIGTTRKPATAQGNGYFFYPKASELRFNDDGSVTFYPDTPKSWTLAFELPGPSDLGTGASNPDALIVGAP